MKQRIVIDTNVFISALRSRRGASYRLFLLLGDKRFEISVSVPLILEYEGAAKRLGRKFGLTHADIEDILDYVCSVADLREIHYLWRPILKDPKDDHVLELAVEASAKFTVTYNHRDFVGASKFGIKVVTPNKFLKEIGKNHEHDQSSSFAVTSSAG
jgi:putative PIN family toxin of toxin-antitoxin system